MANEDPYYPGTSSDNYKYQYSLGGSHQGSFAVGRYGVLESINGAIRFPNVPVAQGITVTTAILLIYIEARAHDGNPLKLKCYGIDEDNTAILTGDPFSRSLTDAVTGYSDTPPSTGSYEDFVVTNQVNEILARAGWSSGNAMGFILKDDSTAGDTYIEDDHTGKSMLVIKATADPDFFPDPSSIAAPTFPSDPKFGFKVAIRGADVKTANPSDISITSAKKEFKIIGEGDVACTAGVEKIIAHGLSYSPAHLAFAESGGYRFKLNRAFLDAPNPVTGSAQGYIGSDINNVRILIDQNKNVYYYIFIDPLEET